MDQPLAPAVETHTGPHRLIHGDCLDVLPTLPPESIDVIVTSPPYNLGVAYRRYHDTRAEHDYLDWLLRVATELRRVMRPDASFFLNISGSAKAPWLPFELIVRLRGLFVLQNHITWIKSIAIGQDSVGHYKPVGGKRFLHHNHEHIFHLSLTGSVPLDRLAIGVPFKDKSNIARRGHARDLRCRGNTWHIPYDTVQSKAENSVLSSKRHENGLVRIGPFWHLALAVVLGFYLMMRNRRAEPAGRSCCDAARGL